MSTAWLHLILAGLLEIVWAIGIKYTEGFTKLWPSLITGAAMVASFYLLAQAIKVIPVGTAYAVWVGIGASGVALVSMVLFKEPATALRLVCTHGLRPVGFSASPEAMMNYPSFAKRRSCLQAVRITSRVGGRSKSIPCLIFPWLACSRALAAFLQKPGSVFSWFLRSTPIIFWSRKTCYQRLAQF
jgi:quaternary ammonium compound-resistance protein SugE